MLTSQLDDARLDHRAHLMGARQRLARAIHQPDKALVRVLHQPLVHRLASDSVAASHIGHRGAVGQNLAHGLIALFHQSQLRECLGGLVERNITGRHLIDELDRLAVDRGYPAVLRCDNGPELACAAMADWAGERVGLHFIPPGQPWRNGYIESFNSRVRDECLNINMFWSLAQARVVISDWKADYNHRRRHSALGYQAPAVYAAARTHP
jgi:putative transposase